MAMGARAGDIARLVVRQGVGLAGVGLVAGIVAALAVTRVLSRYLFDVRPTDPLTFALVAAGLLAVAVLASYLPARRAARVNPMRALRSE